jgi:hypothetical protein
MSPEERRQARRRTEDLGLSELASRIDSVHRAIRVDVRCLHDNLEKYRDALDPRLEALEGIAARTTEILEIIEEGRAFFRFLGRVGNLGHRTLKALLWICLPGALLVGFFYLITHNGEPPGWLRHWVEIIK